ncbi:MAG: AAA family ATPase [Rikenellaceae bacterium]
MHYQNKSYISNIEIEGLNKHYLIKWPINRGVNIISGINGSGKSTLLQAVSNTLTSGSHINPYKPIKNIKIEFENGEIVNVNDKNINEDRLKMSNIDIISTFDSSILIMEAVQKLTDNKVQTELDWSLYKVMERYLKYQLYIGKKAIELLTKGTLTEDFKTLAQQKEVFFDILDEAFKNSHKTVIRERDELMFKMQDIELTPYQLSSGEKQLIIILTLVLTQKREPYVLVMDEPEISLHFEWQKSLLDNIITLNPNVQIIASTHSPALIMGGWMSCVSDVSDIISVI